MKRLPPPLILLYVLLSYIVVQFAWWAYLLYDLNLAVALGSHYHTAAEVEAITRAKLFMLLGEGGVFVVILLVGAFYIRRHLLREQRLSRQEQNFMLATTHELNSPIASIKLNLQTLKRSGISDDQRERMIESGLESVQRLNTLVANILTASRLDAGKLVLANTPVDVAQVVNHVVEQYKPLFAHAGVAVMVGIEENTAIKGDRQALETVLGNLFQNALKYAPGKPLQIRCASRKNTVNLNVCDSGSGIDSRELKNIFKKFYRAENEETRSQKGTGLGLYLVKKLVNLQGGSVHAKPHNPTGLCIEMKFVKA